MFTVNLSDCDVQTFRSGGKGGQHQNKTETGVRVVHRESGARGESREHRSQLQNKKAAFRRMAGTSKFKVWLNRKVFELDGKPSPEEKVARDMIPDNLKVEVKENGKWAVD